MAELSLEEFATTYGGTSSGPIPTEALILSSARTTAKPAAQPASLSLDAFAEQYGEKPSEPSNLFSSFGEPVNQLPQGTNDGTRMSATQRARAEADFAMDGSGPPPRKPKYLETPGGAVTGINRGAKREDSTLTLPELARRTAGTAAQVSDMLTFIGKGLLGQAVYWGANTGVLATTGEEKTAATAATMAKDYFFPPEISTPWAKVAERLGPTAQRAYNENPVGWIMNKVSHFIEKGGEGAARTTGLPPEHFAALAEQFMSSLGAKAIKESVRERFKARVDEVKTGEVLPPELQRRQALPNRAPVEKDITPATEKPVAPAPVMALEDFSKVYDEPKALPDWTGKAALGGAAVAGASLLDEEDRNNALIGGAAALAIKGKGGMWHPEAVERLANPLAERLVGRNGRSGMTLADLRLPDEQLIKSEIGTNVADPAMTQARQQLLADIAADRQTVAWSTRAVSNWLNKHAGTATDPIKDVEIPFGEGTKRLEEVTDAVLAYQPVKDVIGTLPEKVQEGVEAGKIPWDEPVYNVNDPLAKSPVVQGQIRLKSYAALRNYLSHVGDYLRENVDPSKLSQYDLPRAGEETAKRDAEMAKAMEREAAESSKDLPVYKDYGDGFKWVELRLPERLTAEQARGVQYRSDLSGHLDADGSISDGYVALGADGKPISNNYTDRWAVGSTPEEAYLAGQLAREGNQMGHCVGGYCEGVASGESRIFSLRDAKGKSHVTVEVEPETTRPVTIGDLLQKGQEEANRLAGLSVAERKALPPIDIPANILQIKGKQNRAPTSDYLPYVQDFVKGGVEVSETAKMPEPLRAELREKFGEKTTYTRKELDEAVRGLPDTRDWLKEVEGGKWGEVGDLENTGLRGGGNTGIPLFDKFLSDRLERFHTEAEYQKAWKEFAEQIQPVLASNLQRSLAKSHESQFTENSQQRKKWLAQLQRGELPDPRIVDLLNEGLGEGFVAKDQHGSIDPALLIKLGVTAAAAAIGAYFDDRSARGAVLGAILGLGLSSLKPGRGGVLTGLDQALGIVSTRLGNISPALARRARDLELNIGSKTDQRYDTVMPFIKGFEKLPEAERKALDMAYMMNDPAAIQAVLAGKPVLQESYRKVRSLLSQFETQFKDLHRFKEGLTEYLPLVVKDFEGLKKALGEEAQNGLEKILFEAEAAMIKKRGRGLSDVEQSLIVNRFLRSKEATSFMPGYARERTVKMTEALRPFYASVRESLLRYVSAATQDIEAAKFFGKDLATNAQGGKRFTDVDASVGGLIAREMREGRMTADQALVVQGILRARFGPGESAPAGFVQDIRNISNLTLLGQFHAAGTQLADSIFVMYHHNLRPTLEAVAMKLVGRAVDPKDFGLVNHIAEEFTSNRLSGKALTLALKVNAFSTIDRFAKSLQLTAAMRKNMQLAQTDKGLETLKTKWGASYGDDFPQLATDLKNRERTPLVDSLLFGELSNTQPVSKMELPQAYLENPNGRLLYQMKSYMLKQADVIRRDAYNEIKKGGVKNVSRGLKNLAMFATALSLSNIPGDVVKDWLSGREIDLANIDYVENLLQNFGLNRYSMDQARKGKPLEVARDMVLPPYKHYQEMSKLDERSIKYLPPAGRTIYDRWLGGNERKELAQAKSDKAAGKTPKELSSASKDFRRTENEARRQKLIKKLEGR